MKIIIKCGGEDCRREFNGETEERSWLCPYCDHEVMNKDYPFLCARLMEAKRVPDETDWRDLFDYMLDKARTKMIENNFALAGEGIEKTSLSKLIEFENILEGDDQEGIDFQALTLKALQVLGEQVIAQEEKLQGCP